MTYYLQGIDRQGAQVYYTGRAGEGWLSRDHAEAFQYPALDGARAKARAFARTAGLHGVWFMVLSTGGEL